MPNALLFDMDGTVLDSDPIHISVFADMLKPHGIDVDVEYYNSQIMGGRNQAVFARLLPGCDAAALDYAKEAEYRRRLQMDPIEPVTGLIDVLTWAQTAGLPNVMATNACQANIDAVLDGLDLRRWFAAAVSADECTKGKPDPEVYLRAAELAGASPADCIAFEDSATGIASARAAGCVVVGLTTSLSRSALLAAGAHHTITDFTDPALQALLGANIGAAA